ncbi:hypothetical protein N182_06745 [Sinorhizobium sp. GL2]|nr:hypothetical protein N182_06745 [Sinorhizobium sp. GL2]
MMSFSIWQKLTARMTEKAVFSGEIPEVEVTVDMGDSLPSRRLCAAWPISTEVAVGLLL